MRTGILGGTFDPIHIAHLHLAECAFHQLRLDRLLLVPAGDPWQKSARQVTAAEQRIEMCHLAIEDVAGLEVDEREVRREGATYTVETLEDFPGDEELFLILGSDALAGRQTWHRWDDITGLATVVVAPRPTVAVGGGHELELEMSPLHISSTEIRERAGSRRPYRYLVTRPVYDFIESRDLYAQAAGDDMVVESIATEDQS